LQFAHGEKTPWILTALFGKAWLDYLKPISRLAVVANK
jgi:hypothetical protein